MLPDFAAHHLPLYGVTLACAAGLALWVRVQWALARQTSRERREQIAARALASSAGRPRLGGVELAADADARAIPNARRGGVRRRRA